MIDVEERESIIRETLERAMLLLPELVGNLLTSHIATLKLNKKVFDENPEFQKHKGIVASVLESIEGQNVGMKYEEVIKKAIPVIKQQIGMVSGLDTTTVTRPSRNLSGIDLGVL